MFTTNKRVAPLTLASLANAGQGEDLDPCSSLTLALHSMIKPEGGVRSGGNLTSQVRLVVWLAQSVTDTLTGGRGGPENGTGEHYVSKHYIF